MSITNVSVCITNCLMWDVVQLCPYWILHLQKWWDVYVGLPHAHRNYKVLWTGCSTGTQALYGTEQSVFLVMCGFLVTHTHLSLQTVDLCYNLNHVCNPTMSVHIQSKDKSTANPKSVANCCDFYCHINHAYMVLGMRTFYWILG